MNCRVGNALLPTLSCDTNGGQKNAAHPTGLFLPIPYPMILVMPWIDAWLARKGRDSHSFSPLERYLL